MPSETRTALVRMVYAGKRLSSKETLVSAWYREDDPDELLLFKKLDAGCIGGIYEIKVVVDDDPGTSVVGKPKWTSEQVDGDERAALTLRHRAAETDYAVIQSEKRAANDDELARAMAPLRRIIHRDSNSRRRWALAGAITAELLRPPTQAEREEWS